MQKYLQSDPLGHTQVPVCVHTERKLSVKYPHGPALAMRG